VQNAIFITMYTNTNLRYEKLQIAPVGAKC